VVTADSEDPLPKAKEIISIFLEHVVSLFPIEKTTITHISNGFRFLGWNFRKYNGTLLGKPSKGSQEIVIQNIKGNYPSRKNWSQDQTYCYSKSYYQRLSLYHKHAVSSDVFQPTRPTLWCMNIAWAKRRHQKQR